MYHRRLHRDFHPRISQMIPARNPKHSAYSVAAKGEYREPMESPSRAQVKTNNHHKTIKIKVPQSKILRTLIKIEKLSRCSTSGGGFMRFTKNHRISDSHSDEISVISIDPKSDRCLRFWWKIWQQLWQKLWQMLWWMFEHKLWHKRWLERGHIFWQNL